LAAVLLANVADLNLKLAHDFRRAVARVIVHNDDFSVGHRKILLEHTRDGFFNKTLVIIGVNQNADERLRQEIRLENPDSAAQRHAIRILLTQVYDTSSHVNDWSARISATRFI
jgi:hypothetical protein